MKTTEQIRIIAHNLMKENEIMLCNLYNRWLDEREYEDFKDYENVMKEKVIKSSIPCKFIKSMKRPFGFTVIVDNWELSIGITSNSMKCHMQTVKG